MKPKIFLLSCLSFLIFNSSLLISTVRYVSPTGSSTPPYTTWETAADSIMECINISVFGDTIYVANGTYKEQVVMIPGLSLIGAGMDSCVIDTREFISTTGDISVEFFDNCLVKGFQIIVANNTEVGRGISGSGSTSSLITLNRVTSAKYGIYVGSNPIIYKNICDNISSGIYVFNSSSLVRSNIVYTDPKSQSAIIAGIRIEAFNNNYYPIIDSNYIVSSGDGIEKSFGSSPTIKNNVIILYGELANQGIFTSYSDSAQVFNNLVISMSSSTGDGIENAAVQNFIANNNYVIGPYRFSAISSGYQSVINNNVITNSGVGVEFFGDFSITFQYNNSWNNVVNYSGFTADSTNLKVDPMVMNDDSTKGDLDFHLQMFSPLIDAGDPNILDVDGTRSDIGLYGGPYGWSYTYNDLAPRPPHNLTAVVEDGLIKLTWNKNTEADFSHYRIYRDTVTNFIYDTTRIVGITSDTLFYDNLPITNKEKKYYYLVTAFDNQNNQSEPSEEVTVTITGLTEHPPIGDDGFRLLSNYPNPFNPSTIIPYRLKEAGYVKLYVYDIKGELVKTLVNQWQNKGYYEVVFQPNTEERERANSFEAPMGPYYSDVATGIYIYQIMVRGEGDIPVFSDMGKMILLK
ncbi:MAG: hypothetical protein IPJ03_04600 [Ignavibacteriales bacterium]|nr:hypothetical protein [Ignavibacteriales bacterium]